MADDKNKKGPADRTRINLSEAYEVAYWTERLGVSKDELFVAVAEAGPSVKAVIKYLG